MQTLPKQMRSSQVLSLEEKLDDVIRDDPIRDELLSQPFLRAYAKDVRAYTS